MVSLVTSFCFPVKTRFDHRPEDAYERGPSELGQSVQADRAAEEGEGHRLLLRLAAARKDPQAQVRRVRLRVQKRKLLKKKNLQTNKQARKKENLKRKGNKCGKHLEREKKKNNSNFK